MDEEAERRLCWDAATTFVSLLVRPDGEGLSRSAAIAAQAFEMSEDHPELVRQLVTAFAIFASELPADAATDALDRLADDERGIT